MIVIYNPKYEALKRDKMLADEANDNEVKYVGYSLVFHNPKKVNELPRSQADEVSKQP